MHEEKKHTLKDLFDWLKTQFKYVRMFELKFKVKLEHDHQLFDQLLLVSNELEEYEDEKMEIKNVQIKIKKAKVNLYFLQFIPNTAIPIFKLDKKVEG